MNKIATGLIAGGIVTAVGLGYAMNDKNARKKIMKSSKKIASKAGSMMEDAKDDFF